MIWILKSQLFVTTWIGYNWSPKLLINLKCYNQLLTTQSPKNILQLIPTPPETTYRIKTNLNIFTRELHNFSNKGYNPVKHYLKCCRTKQTEPVFIFHARIILVVFTRARDSRI